MVKEPKIGTHTIFDGPKPSEIIIGWQATPFPFSTPQSSTPKGKSLPTSPPLLPSLSIPSIYCLSSPIGDCVIMGELVMVVILNPSPVTLSEAKSLCFSVRAGSVKNLMISNESTVEIVRLSPQNDIRTQSLEGEGVLL
jgi:hypothetical protein